MPNPRKPARLWLEPERTWPDGRVRSAATWIIRDGTAKHATGCSAGDREGAENALQAYLIRKDAKAPPKKHRSPDEITVAEVVNRYLTHKADKVAAPHLMALRAETLLAFWGGRSLEEIDLLTCEAYVQSRHPHRGGARRELQDLKAAVNLARKAKILREDVHVEVPPPGAPRKHYLERKAIARLVRHAYRKREKQVITRGPRKGQVIETSKRPTRHLARFILAALYTGTRSRRVWSASLSKRDGHPWFDLENGIFYREAPDEVAPDNKRAPPIRIPPRLLAHLRRWKDGGHDPANGAQFLCEYRKGRPGDPKKAFRRLVDEVLAEEGSEIVRHSLRHTAATWLLQADVDVHAVAGYLGMNTNTLVRVYAHHDPAFHKEIGDAFTTGRAGRSSAGRARASS